ncbi:unnamed protein product, partial [Staurois parvus]
SVQGVAHRAWCTGCGGVAQGVAQCVVYRAWRTGRGAQGVVVCSVQGVVHRV